MHIIIFLSIIFVVFVTLVMVGVIIGAAKGKNQTLDDVEQMQAICEMREKRGRH